MSDRHFQLRLHCRYAQPDNAIAGLQVEQHTVDGWRPFVLNQLTPGFDIFVYSMLTCQHTYFRLNCAERGLQLTGADGEVELSTDEDWNLQRLRVAVNAQLAGGEPDQATLDYIKQRMLQCPVSKNTRPIADTEVSLRFEG